MAAEVDDMVRDHDAGRPWHAADLGFHLAVARATGNAALARRRRAPVAGTARARLRPPVRTGAPQRKLAGDAEGPQEILDAIRSGKRKAARDSMRAHLRQVLEVMTGVGKANAGASELPPRFPWRRALLSGSRDVSRHSGAGGRDGRQGRRHQGDHRACQSARLPSRRAARPDRARKVAAGTIEPSSNA